MNVQKSVPIELPDELFRKYLSEEEMKVWKSNQSGTFSVWVFAEK